MAESIKISITDAKKMAAAAGCSFTRPTLVKFFGKSRSYVRIGLRHFMDKAEFEQLLKEGDANGTKEQS